METVYPSINSRDEKEREVALTAIELKNLYSIGKLPKEEIKFAESIPNWSWELNSEEKIYMINEIKNWVKINNNLKGE